MILYIKTPSTPKSEYVRRRSENLFCLQYTEQKKFWPRKFKKKNNLKSLKDINYCYHYPYQIDLN